MDSPTLHLAIRISIAYALSVASFGSKPIQAAEAPVPPDIPVTKCACGSFDVTLVESWFWDGCAIRSTTTIVGDASPSGASRWERGYTLPLATGMGVVETGGGPSIVVLLADGNVQVLDCAGTLQDIYALSAAMGAASWKWTAGIVSAQSPQLLVYGAGLESGVNEVYAASLDLADLQSGSANAGARMLWRRRFDGIEAPYDPAEVRGVAVRSDSLVVCTAVRNQDYSGCRDNAWVDWREYIIQPATGEFTNPRWIGEFRVDPEDASGRSVQGLAFDGSVQWTVELGGRVLVARLADRVRGRWRGMALVDGDPAAGQPARLVAVDPWGDAVRSDLLVAGPGEPSDDTVVLHHGETTGPIWNDCYPFPPPARMDYFVVTGSERAQYSTTYGLDLTQATLKPFGQFDGVAHAAFGWQFLAGSNAAGHAAAQFTDLYMCTGQPMERWVFDGSHITRPNESAFLSVVHDSAAGLLRIAGRSGAVYTFWASDPFRPVALKIASMELDGRLLRVRDAAGRSLAEMELDSPVLHAVQQLELMGSGIHCLVQTPTGAALRTLSCMGSLGLYRADALASPDCDVQVDHILQVGRPTVLTGSDYVLASPTSTPSAFSSFVHIGPLTGTAVLPLGATSTARFLSWGTHSDTGNADLAAFPLESWSGGGGPCSVQPQWVARWDGTQDGLPAAGPIRAVNTVDVAGSRTVAVEIGDAATFLIDESGASVPAGLRLLGPPTAVAGAEVALGIQVQHAPSLSRASIIALLDPAVFEGLDVRIGSLAAAYGFQLISSEVVGDRLEVELEAPGGLPRSEFDGEFVVVAAHVRPDAPSGTTTVGLAGHTALRRSDGSEFRTEFTSMDVEIRCSTYDVDGNSRVTTADAVLIMRQLVGFAELSPSQQCAADIDRDRLLTVADAVGVLRRVVGLDPPAGGSSSRDRATIPVRWQVENHQQSSRGTSFTVRLDGAPPVAGWLAEVAAGEGGGRVEFVNLPTEALFATMPGVDARIAVASAGIVAPVMTLLLGPPDSSRGDAASYGQREARIAAGSALGPHGETFAWPAQLVWVGSGAPSTAPSGRTRLDANQPNPFNPQTTIRFELAGAGPVSLQVFDAAGRLVRTLASGWFGEGSHDLQWDGRDAAGRQVASGIYSYRLSAPGADLARRMALVR